MAGGAILRGNSSFRVGLFCWSALVAVGSLKSWPGGIALAHGSDKIFHILFYVPFAPLGLYHPRPGIKVALLLSLFAANYSFLMELLQRGVPGRSFEWADFGAGLAGAALGFLLFGIWLQMQRRGECREQKLSENAPAKF